MIGAHVAPCGHPGECIIGNYVRCLQGCDSGARATRTLPNVKFSVTLAGAIHDNLTNDRRVWRFDDIKPLKFERLEPQPGAAVLDMNYKDWFEARRQWGRDLIIAMPRAIRCMDGI